MKGSGKEGIAVVYRKGGSEKRHCSWCDFMHEDFKVVVAHENSEHGGKKE